MVKYNIVKFNSANEFYSYIKAFVVTILIILLVGCSMESNKQQIQFDGSKGSQYYLSQMNTATSETDKESFQLFAIRSLINENKIDQAAALFNQLRVDLNNSNKIEKALIQAELAVKKERSFDLGSIPFSTLDDSQRIRYYRIKISLDQQNHDINGQIRDYIELEKYGTNKQRHSAINDTWNFLTSLNEQEVSSILVYVNEPILQGWIDLLYVHQNNSNVYPVDDIDDDIAIAKKQDAQFNLLKNAVGEWMLQYTSHPAAQYLPRNIYGENYRLPDDSHSENVALFLPLSGSSKIFGEAIYLGYTEASKLYPLETAQNIQVYDTNSDSLNNLLKQAKQQGAELIVGPLLKQDVASIIQLAPSMPVLALNKIDGGLPTYLNNQICFFSLSPEDEAKDAAQYIYKQNKKRPLLLVSRNDLGSRVANSFLEQWDQIDLTNRGINVQYFDSSDSLRTQMNSGVGIELEGELLAKSTPYENSIDNMLVLDTNDNTEQMQAVDLSTQEPAFDAIYIYASHDELTLIKSMLEMKSNKMKLDEKGNQVEVKKVIPQIYASSRSNVSNTTQDFRYDMDRMQFSDIPLIIKRSDILDELPEYIKNDYSLVRLYAMGIDAWRLVNQFEQLEPNRQNILNGMTGNLSVAEHCEITRTLPWAQYRNGKEITLQ